MKENLEKKCRKELNAFLKTCTPYQLGKGTGVRQQTITRFAKAETSMKLNTWDKLKAYMDAVQKL